MATKYQKKLITFFLIALPLFLATYLLLRYVNSPYVGPNATDQNKLSMIAKNYNYFGFSKTKLEPIIYPYKTLPEKPQLYFNHGVLMEVVVSFFMKAFGYDFWVGRIPYIIAAFLIIPALFFIGKEGKDKSFAILTLIVAVLIPSTSVFGRAVHYQGSFSVLFITLLGLFALKFVQSKNRKFFFLALFSGILGALTDWPITYFSILLIPLFFKNNLKKEGIILSLIIILSGVLVLVYINQFIPIFGGVTKAILNRSLGPQLTHVWFWPIDWVTVIILRLLVYFNPIFVMFSSLYAWLFIKRFKQKKLSNLDLLTFAFVGFAFAYIIIFPEGSFSHPNWVYGLVPGIALTSAQGIFPFIKKKLSAVALIIVLSIIYVLVIENWKTQQNITNNYRYELAQSVSKHFIPYDTIYVNGDTQIDYDIFNYSFLQNAKGVEVTDDMDTKGIRYYVYSCICDLSNNQVNFLANKYKFEEHSSPPARVFIFFLNEKQDKKFPMIKTISEEKTTVSSPPENLPKKIYRLIISYLHLPQL